MGHPVYVVSTYLFCKTELILFVHSDLTSGMFLVCGMCLCWGAGTPATWTEARVEVLPLLMLQLPLECQESITILLGLTIQKL